MSKDDPAVTAAADQADAAAADVRARVRAGYELAGALGVIDWQAQSDTPRRGPRARVIAAVRERIDGGEVRVCEHLAALMLPAGLARPAPPEVVIWMSWHPDLLACPPCANALPKPDETEDRRCDGCGRVTRPGEYMTVGTEVIRADPAEAARRARLAPPLLCSYGLCMKCAARSGAPAPGRVRP